MPVEIQLIAREDIQRASEGSGDKYERLALVADMCRFNTLAIVKRAGSGHLGTSFSAMEIVTWLYFEEMNTLGLGVDHPDRDIYFSSKGHDVPGLYAVLYAAGVLERDKVLRLRRLGGLDGHPDVGIAGIESNSGSLGMGISKARGMAWAKRSLGRGGRVFVMTGDGELQEGQNYEALQSTVQQRVGRLTVIVDHNKVQSDRLVSEIVDIGDLVRKFELYGWRVVRCNGNDLRDFERALRELGQDDDRPHAIVADTVKGSGVSFMEHPRAMAEKGLYAWHAGAPDDASFQAAQSELRGRIAKRLAALGLPPLRLESVPPEGQGPQPQSLLGEPLSQAAPVKAAVTDEFVAKAYGEALVELGRERADLVVLDADLAADCRLRAFETTYPERFVQNGIAEQDMVSMAGGLARQGLLPVVNSFASFLASRANEQIYNNATERTKIVYGMHYAGLIPAGPGKSHQSIRDISLVGALPNMLVVQPANAAEARLLLRHCVLSARESSAIRLAIGPSPRRVELPAGYEVQEGHGVELRPGRDAVLLAYGPVMLHEALTAGELLAGRGFDLRVVNMPWLNRVDAAWLGELAAAHDRIFVLDDHAPIGGLGDCLLAALMERGLCEGRRLVKLAIEGYPACGTPTQALRFHGLDGASLADRIAPRH